MASAQRRAVGVFPDRMQAAAALQALRESHFWMQDVSVIAPEAQRDAGLTTDAPTLETGGVAVQSASARPEASFHDLVELGMPEGRARHYCDRINRGHYLVLFRGSDAEIKRAERLLKEEGIEDWDVYTPSKSVRDDWRSSPDFLYFLPVEVYMRPLEEARQRRPRAIVTDSRRWMTERVSVPSPTPIQEPPVRERIAPVAPAVSAADSDLEPRAEAYPVEPVEVHTITPGLAVPETPIRAENYPIDPPRSEVVTPGLAARTPVRDDTYAAEPLRPQNITPGPVTPAPTRDEGYPVEPPRRQSITPGPAVSDRALRNDRYPVEPPRSQTITPGPAFPERPLRSEAASVQPPRSQNITPGPVVPKPPTRPEAYRSEFSSPPAGAPLPAPTAFQRDSLRPERDVRSGATPTTAGEKRAIGIFNDRLSLEMGLEALRKNGFPIHRLSILVKEAAQAGSAGPLANGDSRNYGNRNSGGHPLEGAASLMSGLSRVTLPETGPALVLGPDSETLVQASHRPSTGSDVSFLQLLGLAEEPARLYGRHLREGAYLVTFQGQSEDMLKAASTLSHHGWHDWGLYDVQVSRPL